MQHCTTDCFWYLGKFLVGFAGMMFIYSGLLKEKEYCCLCLPRMREAMRDHNSKRPDRCRCNEGNLKKIYSCGCRRNIP